MKANTICGQRQYAFVSQFNYIREAGTEGEEKDVKATVSGIYITGVRGIRGSLEQPEKKNGFWQKMLRKARGEEK